MTVSMESAEVAVERVAIVSPALAAARARAKTAAKEAVEVMRERVREALAGEVVRGLVDLNPGGEAWKGARVHGNGRHGVDAFLPTDGRPALCIDRHGELVYARIEGRKVVVDPVEPDGVLVEDAEPYARALVVVLSRHCTASETTIRGYDHAAALAHRIRAALFGP